MFEHKDVIKHGWINLAGSGWMLDDLGELSPVSPEFPGVGAPDDARPRSVAGTPPPGKMKQSMHDSSFMFMWNILIKSEKLLSISM